MSWSNVALGDVCKVIAGQSPEGKYYNNDGVGLPFYQGKKDFGKVYINPPTVWTADITKEAIKDDILMSVRAPVGPVNISRENICIGRGLAAIRASDKVATSYLFNFLLSIEKDLVGSSGAVFNSISKGQIENLKIPLPPLPIQKKIVAKLDAIFIEIEKATAAAEANSKNAEALFQSHLKQTFEGDTDWKKSTIGEVLSVIKNGINCEQNKIPIGNKITRIETIAKKRFDFERVGYANLAESEKQRSRLLVGDILFSHINSPIHVGKTAIYEAEEEIYHGINLLLMRTNKDVNPYFFNHFLNHVFSIGYWEKNCKKSVNQASVNQKDISKVVFNYPQLIIQEKIVSKLDAVSAELTISAKSYAAKVAELAKLKQAILKQAFNGDLTKEF